MIVSHNKHTTTKEKRQRIAEFDIESLVTLCRLLYSRKKTERIRIKTTTIYTRINTL